MDLSCHPSFPPPIFCFFPRRDMHEHLFEAPSSFCSRHATTIFPVVNRHTVKLKPLLRNTYFCSMHWNFCPNPASFSHGTFVILSRRRRRLLARTSEATTTTLLVFFATPAGGLLFTACTSISTSTSTTLFSRCTRRNYNSTLSSFSSSHNMRPPPPPLPPSLAAPFRPPPTPLYIPCTGRPMLRSPMSTSKLGLIGPQRSPHSS